MGTCDQRHGQCPCRPRVTGRRCSEPLQAHYFPSLHQFQYEVEDGHTPSGVNARFDFDEELFPGFSWRGYAIFSNIQVGSTTMRVLRLGWLVRSIHDKG